MTNIYVGNLPHSSTETELRNLFAAHGHNSLAMLRRRPGETLAELLSRLDQAIERAWTESIYTDEINPRFIHLPSRS